MTLTPAQCRGARAMLGWTQAELAARAGRDIVTVQRLEKGGTETRADSLADLRAALEAAGAVFLNGAVEGVAIRI